MRQGSRGRLFKKNQGKGNIKGQKGETGLCGQKQQKRRERQRGRGRERGAGRGRQSWRLKEKERERWEVGRALLKGNIVNECRRYSQWLQLTMQPVRTSKAGQYRCTSTNNFAYFEPKHQKYRQDLVVKQMHLVYPSFLVFVLVKIFWRNRACIYIYIYLLLNKYRFIRMAYRLWSNQSKIVVCLQMEVSRTQYLFNL